MQLLKLIALLALGAAAAPPAPVQARDEFLVTRNCYNWIKRNEQHNGRVCADAEEGPGERYKVNWDCYNLIKRNDQHVDGCVE